MKFASSLKLKLIYVFRINDAAHHDCLKVGEATCDSDNVFGLAPNCKALNDSAKKRINQYTQTAGISYDLLYTECTLYNSKIGICSFNDKEVHSVLERSGIKKKVFDTENKANEWFITDLETVKRAIAAVKEGKQSLTSAEVTHDHSPIIFRPEQREAIDKTKKQFKKSQEMLWYAKMRFGKTLSALQVVKEMEFRRTLILTHRPVVDSGWFEDFGKIFYDRPEYRYGSKNNGDSHATLEQAAKSGKGCYVYFASMQDLRGSELVGGNFDKNDEVFSTAWDLIIVDEAHEGTQTSLGKAVMGELKKEKTKILRLSGTPFNLLDDFKEDDIYTWDYVMEQRAKAAWDELHQGDPNPYAGLPTMNIFTYDLGRLMPDFIDEDVAFKFREFFRVKEDGTFTHEKDVRSFLNLLTKEDPESCYPFANDEYRNIFRHTLWILPGVKAAKSLSEMLQSHPVFQHFKVVNVAGNGDEDEERADALEAVRHAIGADPDASRTITLSCGRLTTGVSVKEWTGVFMLSGSFNTAASSYMQTIFRVQTPATINGRVKEQAYVFDFAPDRTLQVLATVPKMSTKAGKTTEGQKQAMGEFLNFCPVISIEGSKMETLNVNRMLEQLKKAYVERVVRNGFEDGALYNDELMKLTDVEIQEFEDLKGIIGQTKAMGNSGQIDINNQGLTNEEYEEKEKLEKKKKKKELTEEEKKRLEELKKKKKLKEDAISILRGISIRMPLMIYGADVTNEETQLTIDNFTSLIDPQSWEEFMPRGVSKQKFNAFKKYYDPDIFSAAAKRIRAMARAADKLSVEERIERITSIFATFRNPDKETVLTPWRVVNMHLGDALGGYNFFNEDYSETINEPRYIQHNGTTADVFSIDSHIVEINSKSGLYPLYVAYSIYRTRAKESMFAVESVEDEQRLWDETVANNIFVVCKTPMAKAITRRTLLGFRKGRTNMWAPDDLINKVKNQPELFIKKVHDLVGKNMKINAIVGNPPYQLENGEGNRKEPIYHFFFERAFELSSLVTLITPGRFLFNTGQTPSDWNEKMLNDTHFKVIKYTQDSQLIFSNVSIKGGIAITLRNSQQEFGPIGIYTAFEELNSISSKVVRREDFLTFSELIYTPYAYKFTATMYDSNPGIENYLGNYDSLRSNIFERVPQLFFDNIPDDSAEYIQIYGILKGKRMYKWIRREYVNSHINLDKYKVFVPEANGSGAIGEVLSTPVIGQPVIGHTQSFISIGAFDTLFEATAAYKYVCTKFARTMLAVLKATQHNNKESWKCVPMQDFTEYSDIDWSQSVADIDRQLYAKYGLNETEVAFIESMIKPM